MAGWLFSESSRILLDPGCGSGSLLIPAARHPARGRTRLVGIDTDRVAVAMAIANTRLRGMQRCDLRIGNFLTDLPSEVPDRVALLICSQYVAMSGDPSLVSRFAGVEDRLRRRGARNLTGSGPRPTRLADLAAAPPEAGRPRL